MTARALLEAVADRIDHTGNLVPKAKPTLRQISDEVRAIAASLAEQPAKGDSADALSLAAALEEFANCPDAVLELAGKVRNLAPLKATPQPSDPENADAIEFVQSVEFFTRRSPRLEAARTGWMNTQAASILTKLGVGALSETGAKPATPPTAQRHDAHSVDAAAEVCRLAIRIEVGFSVPFSAMVRLAEASGNELRTLAAQRHDEGADEVAEGLCDPVVGARFGHHPVPAIDFEIEVQSLQGRLFDAKRGISKVGSDPETLADVLAAIQKAMTFRVGGVPSCINAKALLRQLEADALLAIVEPAAHGAGAAVEVVDDLDAERAEDVRAAMRGDRDGNAALDSLLGDLANQRDDNRRLYRMTQQRSEQGGYGGGVDARFEEWFGAIWAGSDDIPVPEWQGEGWNDYIAQRQLALGAWEAALSTQPLPQPAGVSDAMVETVGSGLYIYWNDVNEKCRNTYRAKVRGVLEDALHPDQAKDGGVS